MKTMYGSAIQLLPFMVTTPFSLNFKNICFIKILKIKKFLINTNLQRATN